MFSSSTIVGLFRSLRRNCLWRLMLAAACLVSVVALADEGVTKSASENDEVRTTTGMEEPGMNSEWEQELEERPSVALLFLKMLAFFIIFFLLLVGVLVYRKKVNLLGAGKHDSKYMRVMEVMSLGQGQLAVYVECEGERLLLGVNKDRVCLLHTTASSSDESHCPGPGIETKS